MAKTFIRVRNWKQFQHYHDRSPKWIKFHAAILRDFDLLEELSEVEQAQLFKLWLLAAEFDNKIPRDERYIRQRLQSKRLRLARFFELGYVEEWEGNESEPKWPSRYVSASLREQVLTRNEHKCVSCGAADLLEVDHIVPVSQGGESVKDNLQTLCRSCNRRKRASLDGVAPRYADATQTLQPSREVEEEIEPPSPPQKGDRRTLRETGENPRAVEEARKRAESLAGYVSRSWDEYPDTDILLDELTDRGCRRDEAEDLVAAERTKRAPAVEAA